MQRCVWFLAAAATIAGCALIGSCVRLSRCSPFDLPVEKISADEMLCSGDELLVTAPRFDVAMDGSGRARKHRTFLEVLRVDAAGSLRAHATLEGQMLRDLSWPAEDVIYAVLFDWYRFRGGLPRGKLWRSGDGGRSWVRIGGPSDHLVGVAFATRTQGYAWTLDALYYTEDGAESWALAAQTTQPAYYPMGVDLAAVTKSGVLWISAGHPWYGAAEKKKQNVLLRVSEGKDVQLVDAEVPYSLEALASDRDDVVWALGETGNGKEPEVVVLRWTRGSDGKWSRTVLKRWAGMRGKRLSIVGSRMVAHLTVANPRLLVVHRVYASADEGQRWTRLFSCGRSPKQVCLAGDSGVWIVSAGKVYPPRNVRE